MIDLKEYGYLSPGECETDGGIVARVSAVHRERYEIICERGLSYARLKAGQYYGKGETFPTTGDFVCIRFNPDGDSLILKTLPRKSYFSRLDPSSSGHGEQAVAANFDDVFVMQSLNRDFNLKRLERYLALGWQSGGNPAVILTKTDLVENPAPQIQEAERIAVGVPVFPVSARTGEGMEKLGAYLKPGKTAVFLGSSGVGKSSLVNALAGEEIMTVNGIRQSDGRGRHTTTYRQLVMLKSGVMIIDTPGMRELGMWDVAQGLGSAFADVEQFIGQCKFLDCTHKNEPGCAILGAIERGELSPERWRSYQSLKNEAAYSDDKESYLQKKQQWHKNIAKTNKQRQALNREGR